MMDTYTARIVWYMQRNYQADIQREKAQIEEDHLLWSLFDCSFHVNIVRHLRTPRMPDARCWQVRVTKHKEWVQTRCLSQEGTSLSNERSAELSTLSILCKCDALPGNLTASGGGQASRICSCRRRRLHILFIICCHKQGVSAVTGESVASRKKLNSTSWAILTLLILYNVLIQPSRPDFLWRQLLIFYLWFIWLFVSPHPHSLVIIFHNRELDGWHFLNTGSGL